LISLLSYVFFRNLSFGLVIYKAEAVITTDIQNFGEDKISKEKYFDNKHELICDKRIENKKMIDFLIGKKQFNLHLDTLESKLMRLYNYIFNNFKFLFI